MFWLWAIALGGSIFLTAASKGGREALWLGFLAATLLTPTWLIFPFGSLTIDLRAVGSGLGLLVLIAFPDPLASNRSPIRWRPLALTADAAVIVLVLAQAVSQYQCGRFGPLTAPDIMRRWLLPYLVGRCFLGDFSDIPRMIAVAMRFLLGMSAYAVVEAFIKVNLVNKALGKTFGLLESGEGYRWGLKRAQGPLDHPIFFGMMLVLLLPLAFEGFRLAKAGKGPKWWMAVLPTLSMATIVTVSRGAQISLILTGVVTSFFVLPRWRVLILAVVVVGGGSTYVAMEAVTSALGKLAGESEEDVRIITIKDEEYEYTGSKHRILLFKAYEDAFEEAGYFGFGYEMIGIELEESIAQRFSSIDNHYIRFFLQHGWVGLRCFFIVVGVTLVGCGILAWDPRRAGGPLAGAMFGAFLTVDFGLLSVWFSPDFGSVWLFGTGLAANLQCLPRESAADGDGAVRAAPAAAVEAWPRRRLVPAHSPVRPTTLSRQEPSS